MKKLSLIFGIIYMISGGSNLLEAKEKKKEEKQMDGKNFYSFDATSLTGEKILLAKYKGKAALVVNTASKCGLTPQYEQLEALYKKYSDKGFVVLGFPSNDFLGQEPGTDAEIKKFCELKYNISFPLFTKNKVKGGDKQQIYKYLTEETDPKFHGEISWNFEKFVVDRTGNVVARFSPKVTPDSKEVIEAIEKVLK